MILLARCDSQLTLPWYTIYFNYDGHRILMFGKCDDCGLDNVEIMVITKKDTNHKVKLCNQCRPADGAYAY